MGNKNIAYRHPDYPVTVNGTFATRVQAVDLNENKPTQTVDELGNFTPAGVSQEAAQLTGSIRWFPIGNEVENLFAATTGSNINLSYFTGNDVGVTVQTPVSTMTGCRVISGQYSVAAPNGEFQATYNFKGTGLTIDQTNSIVATAPSGVGAYRSKDVAVKVGSQATARRCSGVTARFDFPNQDLFELNNANMVGTVLDSPRITCDIDFYESDLMAGDYSPTIDSPNDIVVTVATTVKTITLKNMVGGTKTTRGTVRGWATRRYSYTSSGDSATLGMSFS